MKMSKKNPGNCLKIHMKLSLSIFLEEVNDHKGYGNIFYHKSLPLRSAGNILENAYEKVWEPCSSDIAEFVPTGEKDCPSLLVLYYNCVYLPKNLTLCLALVRK